MSEIVQVHGRILAMHGSILMPRHGSPQHLLPIKVWAQ
jgi:hypothetical protein